MLAHPPVGLATPRDARSIAEFSRDYIEHGLRWTYDRRRVLQAMADPAVNVAVAHEAGRLLGFGIMDYGSESAHLVLLGVRPHRQRRGLGRRLVRWLEKSARTAGVRRVLVEARADNPGAIAFYRRLGYRERVRIAGYYAGTLDAVRLEHDLRATAR